MTLESAVGLSFDHVFVLGRMRRAAAAVLAGGGGTGEGVPDGLVDEALPELSPQERARRLLYTAMTRSRHGLVLAFAARSGAGVGALALAAVEDARLALHAEWESRDEELFGPAEALHFDLSRAPRRAAPRASARLGTRLGELRLRHRPRHRPRRRALRRARQARVATAAAPTTNRSPRRSRTSTRGLGRR